MDSELRSGDVAHPSADADSVDFDMISNLLISLETEGDNSGPVTTMLRELGIRLPRLSPNE